MRLLNVQTVQLEAFYDENIPRYAILSHTWGQEEITLQDMGRIDTITKFGYRKINRTCDQAIKGGIPYAWVDTCWIDKTSSAELSEAINTMYRWYAQAEVCYAYLVDVPTDVDVEK